MSINPELTIGPVLFHWPVEKWRDFYFRIADEAPVSTVYVGEVVCSKRIPFIQKHYMEVIERLEKAGKKAVLSTLAEVMIKLDSKSVESICAMEDITIEANDASALYYLSNRPHNIGMFINTYNEETLEILAKKGAKSFCLPPELPAEAIELLAAKAKELDVETEVQVYGRIPLALSARCYHARAHSRTKDGCLFVCEEDPDGLDLETMDGKKFLTINGIQTLSQSCLNLMQELPEMVAMGVDKFRLSPHDHDMVKVAELFRSVLDKNIDASEAIILLEEIGLNAPFSNGFYQKEDGCRWINKEKAA